MGNFMDELERRVSPSDNKSKKELKIINMQQPSNYGTVMFVPITGKSNELGSSDAIQTISQVLEVAEIYEMEVKGKKSEGKRFLKLLPDSIYDLNPPSKEDMDFNKVVKSKFYQLYNKKIPKLTNFKDPIIRIKNYTLLMGYLIRHMNLDGKVINENCPAILVFSSRNFDKSLAEAIRLKDKISQSTEWRVNLLNRSEVRKLFLMINYELQKGEAIGYKSTISIERFSEDLESIIGKGNEHFIMDKETYKAVYDQLDNPIKSWLRIEGDSLFSLERVKNFDNVISKLIAKYIPNSESKDDIKDNPKDNPPTYNPKDNPPTYNPNEDQDNPKDTDIPF